MLSKMRCVGTAPSSHHLHTPRGHVPPNERDIAACGRQAVRTSSSGITPMAGLAVALPLLMRRRSQRLKSRLHWTKYSSLVLVDMSKLRIASSIVIVIDVVAIIVVITVTIAITTTTATTGTIIIIIIIVIIIIIIIIIIFIIFNSGTCVAGISISINIRIIFSISIRITVSISVLPGDVNSPA
ncbi:hypothetical protein AK812_SmicGene10083 [Symbiodinium microadriaticum]|uniref:Uncharacterized protein n=1 Tax=Symbiodinium microadriaticum TaxID=2951 RepID=A0A1Q9EGU5_SYMMI|nr:hypothetical protein AK812_SmicGene10083 [Symbiodinium microadriaticum]